MKGTLKPMWWGLFAGGGMVAALLYPVHVLRTALLFPAGVAEAPAHEHLHAVFSHWLFRGYLLVLVSLPLFHAAHRIMAALMDFGLRPWRPGLAVLLYGGAFLGSAFTLWTIVTM